MTKEIPILYSFVLEQEWNDGDFDKEDGGMAYIYNVYNEHLPELFVRIQSWDDDAKHKIFNEALYGRKIKVTIETLD